MDDRGGRFAKGEDGNQVFIARLVESRYMTGSVVWDEALLTTQDVYQAS